MAWQEFLEFHEGATPEEAFDARVEELENFYGDDVDCTMATCELAYDPDDEEDDYPVLGDVYNDEASKVAAEDWAEDHNWGDKWMAYPIDLGEIPNNYGLHMWAFYGKADA